ncbi:MAG TPA: carboxypeptidase-like regulatory domain-containing protein [Planctomycetaceae bacterium]|jgi:hypothetical protein
MKTPRILFCLALCVAAMTPLGAQNPAANPVVVEGVVFEIDPGGKYVPCANASIQAIRGGNLLKNPFKTGSDGKYSFTVASGAPFSVTFSGSNRVPELTQVAGLAGTKNFTNVTLLTAAQYQQSPQGERYKLKSKLQSALEQVPDDSDAARFARAMLDSER